MLLLGQKNLALGEYITKLGYRAMFSSEVKALN